jgi:spore coat polysaccharide biosynthesis protein SpsF
MKTVAILQARMGSDRLPGKVLMDLAGQTVLERVCRRAARISGVDEIIVATSDYEEDDAIESECNRLGIAIWRGDAVNVLERFAGAAEHCQAEICIRITCDCPLIDPGVSGMILRRFLNASPAVDYASNKIPQSFPRGLDTEVFFFQALQAARSRANQSYELTHVTIYMYEHPEQFRLLSIVSDVDRAQWRWTLDAPEDLAFIRQVYNELGPGNEFGWEDVLELINRKPELLLINGHVRQKHPHES